ncbi:MAG: hypothetical protein L6Q99_08865 [Planctomycetes bacterium]|nr:hypothetical protein [Planctomycetota bacterium]
MRTRLPLGFAIVAALVVSVLFARPARAQCLPDGLDQGPCCLSTFPNLPAFPNMPGLSVRWLAFNNCNVAANATMCARIFPPQPKQFQGAFACGAFDIPIRLRQCGLNIGLWSGTLNGYYSRNWQAASTVGTALTVWRFVVNGDLKPSTNVPNNQNFRPACQPFTQSVYFTGYIDYALDCSTNTWQVAWMLTHECDAVHHTSNSARPAPASGYHPGRSFTVVGPGAGFVVNTTNPLISNGPVAQGSFRNNIWVAPNTCTFEEPAIGGSLTPFADTCFCNPGPTGQYSMGTLAAGGACGTQLMPSPIGNFNQKRIGTWTNGNVFPGIQTLLFDFGYLDYVDGCTGVLSSEWFEGVETIRGFPAFEFTGLALGTQFEDVMSCNASPTVPNTLIGAPHVVNYIVNLNLP